MTDIRKFKVTLPQKPHYQKISQDIDFLKLFKIVEQKFENCFLIESLGVESSERYSVLGFDPEKIYSGGDEGLTISSKEGQKDFIENKNAYNLLSQIVPQNIISRNYSGGLFGFLSYEAYKYFEPKVKLETHPDFELFKFGLFTDGVVYDKTTGEVFYFYYENDRSDLVKNMIKQIDSTDQQTTLSVKFIGNTIDPQRHSQIVADTIEEIKSGNSFQVEVGMKSKYEVEGDTTLIYEELRKINPSPFMFYCKFGQQKVIGASPELLFRLENGEMQTSPLAGTIKRGKTDEEDMILARTLLNDPKEIAEHNMLVDMHRNDIGRVARPGTVKVRRLMEIKRFSHVQHISSDVTGIIDKKFTMFDGIANIFPGGVVSGAPKVETVKIIAGNEQAPRGPYGGALGYFGLNGNCTFAIPIRSLFISGNKAFAQTSSGIVYDSVAENEYQELINKLQAMSNVLAKFS